MSEPKRWLEEGTSPEIECLMRAARAEQPGEASLTRTLAAVGVGLGTIGVAGAAGASTTAASGGATGTATATITVGMLAKWAALGATLGTVAVGGATIARDTPLLTEAPATSVRQPVRARAGSTRAGSPFPEPPAEERSSATNVASPAPGPPGARVSARAGKPFDAASAAPPVSGTPVDVETLAEEVRTVDRARAALAAGRAVETLAVLDEYERRFQEGRFTPEVLYLRMEAFVSLGRTVEGRAAAGRLLADYPSSPHGARARAVFSRSP